MATQLEDNDSLADKYSELVIKSARGTLSALERESLMYVACWLEKSADDVAGDIRAAGKGSQKSVNQNAGANVAPVTAPNFRLNRRPGLSYNELNTPNVTAYKNNVLDPAAPITRARQRSNDTRNRIDGNAQACRLPTADKSQQQLRSNHAA